MKLRAVLLVMLFACLMVWVAVASATTMGVHLMTAHTAEGLNDKNPGLYLRTAAGFTAGVFYNSNSRISTYAGWTWETNSKRFALTAGGVTGYPGIKVLPLLVPSVRFDFTEKVSARLSLLPKPPRHGAGIGVHLSLERDL